MKLITTQADLLYALKTVSSAVSTGNSHPILSCCQIDATPHGMTVTAFNLDLGIRVSIPAQVEKTGSTALPYKLLSGLVSRFEADEVITLSGDSLAAAEGFYGLAAANPDDFPAMPTVEAPEHTLELQHGIKACLVAASGDASKQILQGIHLANGFMESTDGHRMARYPVNLPSDIDLVLPASTMRLLQDRVFGISVSNGQAIIDAGDEIVIYSRIMDGKYPDIGKLIPTKFKHSCIFDRHRLSRALERVALIAEAHNSIVKLKADNGQAFITADADANNGKEIVAFTGPATGTWLFNVNYLLDGLKAFRHSKTITFSANGATEPVLLTPVENADENYLIMPVQGV